LRLRLHARHRRATSACGRAWKIEEPAGKLVMQTKADSYTALVGVKAMGTNLSGGGPNCADTGATRVVAGDPTKSLLVDKIENMTPQCGLHMPPGGMLTPAEIKQVKDWVMAGAKND
jgi:hypothetical protein